MPNRIEPSPRYSHNIISLSSLLSISMIRPPNAIASTTRIHSRTRTALVPVPNFSLAVFDDLLSLGEGISSHPPASEHNTLFAEDLFGPGPALSPQLLALVDVLSIGCLTLSGAVETECASCACAIQGLALCGR